VRADPPVNQMDLKINMTLSARAFFGLARKPSSSAAIRLPAEHLDLRGFDYLQIPAFNFC
jgi:hypothetical protein